MNQLKPGKWMALAGMVVLSSHIAWGQITREQCYQCHANSSLQKTIATSSGQEVVPLYVDSTAFKTSTHHALLCVQCHTDITTTNLFTHASGGANQLVKTYGSWARFSKSDTTLDTDNSPRTRNYYTTAAMSCNKSGCHSTKSSFDTTRHHTIWRLTTARVRMINGEAAGENYDKTCSRCHTTCATCHFKTTKTQKYAGDVTAIWDSLMTLGEGPFPNAATMTEWAMDWTVNVKDHAFETPASLSSNNDVCRSCHVGYYKPPMNGFLSDQPPYPKAYGTNIKRHPQFYEAANSPTHQTLKCANCHTNVHSYPDGDFDWQALGDAQCTDCHNPPSHYTNHTTVDCIACHFTGFARSKGQSGHDVWRWPVNNRVRPLAVKYNEGLSWYPHNIVRPDSASLCGKQCHYAENLLGVQVITGVKVSDVVPAAFVLRQNYPNPFNPSTVIPYGIPESRHVRIAIYDLLGHTVKVLVDEMESPGIYRVTWDGTDASGNILPGGVYFYRLEAGAHTQTKKLILLQ